MNKLYALFITFFGLLSMPSWARDLSHGAEEGHKSILSDPTFWLAISFIIFIAVAAKPAFKAIAAMLDKRAQLIEERLEEARKLKEEAVEMRAEAERAQHEAIEEAARIIEYAKKDAEHIRELGITSLEKAIEKKKSLVEQRISSAQEKAINEIKGQTANIAYQAANKLIDENYTSKDDDTLIDDTINNLSDLMQRS
ncbi:MAG: hypothetical protein ACK5LE_04125 [Alphaproteobacteria bacterium]